MATAMATRKVTEGSGSGGGGGGGGDTAIAATLTALTVMVAGS